MPAKTWTDALLSQARELYESGKYSCAQIALRIGIKSRNAIIGQSHRKGWVNPNHRKGGTRKGDKKSRTTRIRKPILVQQPPEEPVRSDFLGIEFMDLQESQCRYPHGLTSPYLFCGNPTKEDSSYCAYHHGLCHEPTKLRGAFVSSQRF